MNPLAQTILRDATAARQENPELRYGQAVFNAAYTLRPAGVNAVRGTDVDPFNDDTRIEAFLDAVTA